MRSSLRVRPGLASLVAVAILLIGALAGWDESRESSSAFEEFPQEQSTLATSAASELTLTVAAATPAGARACIQIPLAIEEALRDSE